MKYDKVVEKVTEYLCNSEFIPPEERVIEILRLLQPGDEIGDNRYVETLDPIIDEDCKSLKAEIRRQAAEEMREDCAAVAKAHKGLAAKRRKAKGLRLSDCDNWEEIEAEERGEDIAAEMIERAIRALEWKPASAGGSNNER